MSLFCQNIYPNLKIFKGYWLVSVACILIFPFAELAAQTFTGTSRLSTDSIGAGANAAIANPNVAANGKFVVFNSNATNLVAFDAGGNRNIFRRDLTTGEISLVSIKPSSSDAANGDSQSPSISPISPDNFYAISFSSDATNLSDRTDANSRDDIYYFIPSLSIMDRASLASDGSDANLASSTPSITVQRQPDKILIAYASAATNLVSSDTNSVQDVFLATINITDGQASLPTNLMLSKSASGVLANARSASPKISGDGNYVVFESNATNLIDGQTLSSKQVYLYNVQSAALTLISKTSAGVAGNGDSEDPYISYSGRYITYRTKSTNLISGSVGGASIIVHYDTLTGVIRQANTTSSGVAGDGTTSARNDMFLSPDGNFVSFSDNSTNIVSSDTNDQEDIFLKDITTGAIIRTSVSSQAGEADDSSRQPAFSADGYNSLSANNFYLSDASNLVSNDSEGVRDLFSANVTLPLSEATSETSLETPADVSITGRRIRVSLKRFGSVSTSSFLPVSTLATPRIVYSVSLRGSRRRDAQSKISKRNTVTFARLRPGKYRVNYRVVAKLGTRTLYRTQSSPFARFTR